MTTHTDKAEKRRIIEAMEEVRLELMLSQEKAAGKIGITLVTYNGFVTGRRPAETMSDIVARKIVHWMRRKGREHE